jgi:hypothetical protein
MTTSVRPLDSLDGSSTLASQTRAWIRNCASRLGFQGSLPSCPNTVHVRVWIEKSVRHPEGLFALKRGQVGGTLRWAVDPKGSETTLSKQYCPMPGTSRYIRSQPLQKSPMFMRLVAA